MQDVGGVLKPQLHKTMYISDAAAGFYLDRFVHPSELGTEGDSRESACLGKSC
jgi:hypothetical protein